jgi:hypothetical protein
MFVEDIFHLSRKTKCFIISSSFFIRDILKINSIFIILKKGAETDDIKAVRTNGKTISPPL